jgi:uncharacterized protein
MEIYDLIDEADLKAKQFYATRTISHWTALNGLLNPAISNEALQSKVKADANSIQVFANNLSQLLLRHLWEKSEF